MTRTAQQRPLQCMTGRWITTGYHPNHKTTDYAVFYNHEHALNELIALAKAGYVNNKLERVH